MKLLGASNQDITNFNFVLSNISNQLTNDQLLAFSEKLAHNNLVGTEFNDVLVAGFKNVYLQGGRGNDLLFSGDGDDILRAGDGNDLLVGGEGNDTLIGGTGNDYLGGGNGDDIYILR